MFDGYASDRSAAECYITSGRSENDVTGSCVSTNQSRTKTVAKRRQANVSSDNKNADARKCEKGVLSFKKDEPQLRLARLWLNMIIAQSDAHNFDAAVNNNGLQPVRPRSVEAFQRTDVDSTDYDLLLVEPRSVQRSHNCVGTMCTSIC